MSDSPLASTGFARPTGYHDFGGLAGLRGEAARGSDGAVRETARQFEAYFIQHMMKTMREAVERSDLTDNGDADTFQDLMDKEVATKMAERGALGLADLIERSLAQRLQPTAQDVLAARQAMALQPAAEPRSLAGGAPPALAVPRSGGALSLESGRYVRPLNPAPAATPGTGGAE